jgi:hypothetical protein
MLPKIQVAAELRSKLWCSRRQSRRLFTNPTRSTFATVDRSTLTLLGQFRR